VQKPRWKGKNVFLLGATTSVECTNIRLWTDSAVVFCTVQEEERIRVPYFVRSKYGCSGQIVNVDNYVHLGGQIHPPPSPIFFVQTVNFCIEICLDFVCNAPLIVSVWISWGSVRGAVEGDSGEFCPLGWTKSST
jgi:hypothetical protein